MAYTEGARLILEDSEMEEFLRRVNHPDPDVLRRRDELFAMLAGLDMTENDDGSIDFEFSMKPAAAITASSPMKNIHFENKYIPRDRDLIRHDPRCDTELIAA